MSALANIAEVEVILTMVLIGNKSVKDASNLSSVLQANNKKKRSATHSAYPPLEVDVEVKVLSGCT